MLRRRLSGLSLLALAVASLALHGVAWWAADRGLERMDESYVAMLVAHPQDSLVGGEVYLFGFVLHPIAQLTGNDLAANRRISLTITAVLLMLTSYAALRLVRRLDERPGGRGKDALSALAVAGTGLLLVAFVTSGPGYNSLAFNALTLLLLALVMVASASPRARAAGAVLIGVAGWLTFTAKPPTAAGAALLAVLALIGLRRLSLATLGWAALGVLASAAATLAAMGLGPAGLVSYLERGLEHLKLLRSHSSTLTLLGLTGPPTDRFLAIGLLPLGIAVLALVLINRRAGSGRAGLIAAVGVVLLLLTGAGVWALLTQEATLRSFGLRGLAIGMGILPVALLALGWPRRPVDADRAPVAGRREIRTLIALCLALPYVYALFTNASFWSAMPHAAAFWTLAGVLAALSRHDLSPQASRATAAVVLACSLAITMILTSASLHRRFGEPPASANTVAVPVAGGSLLMTPQRAAVAQQIEALRRAEGITRETPIIDLTGTGAGYVLQLGGRPLGRAFLIGAFEGGADAARYSLGLESCRDRAAAYLLYAPDSRWSTAAGFLDASGLDAGADYVTAGAFTDVTPAGTMAISLMRPTPSVGRILGCS